MLIYHWWKGHYIDVCASSVCLLLFFSLRTPAIGRSSLLTFQDMTNYTYWWTVFYTSCTFCGTCICVLHDDIFITRRFHCGWTNKICVTSTYNPHYCTIFLKHSVPYHRGDNRITLVIPKDNDKHIQYCTCHGSVPLTKHLVYNYVTHIKP